jgi:hypothetical protein
MSVCSAVRLCAAGYAHVLWPQEAMSVIRLTNHAVWGAMAVLGTDRGSGVLHVYLLPETMGWLYLGQELQFQGVGLDGLLHATSWADWGQAEWPIGRLAVLYQRVQGPALEEDASAGN